MKLPQNFLVVNLCDLEKTCQCPVDGLISADFFAGMRVQIDFRENTPMRAAKAITVPLKERRGIWQLPVHVNGGERNGCGWIPVARRGCPG